MRTGEAPGSLELPTTHMENRTAVKAKAERSADLRA
jgi:hypothetical protein